MSEEANNPPKKNIIDEDWKSRMETEKEAARREKEKTSTTESESSADRQAPLPPPTLSFLVGTMYLQGTIALGMLPNPMTNKQDTYPEQAKHTIDLLTMLQEKTNGNRTSEETEELEAVLHELRLAYLNVPKK
ncbi:MAG: DUF1844 domain-containing protein [Pirellulales bacterium]|nr:DUF1844 domain-containing protein [Pirellulales bacterium]